MKLKLSDQIKLFNSQKEGILKHFNKVGYNTFTVTDYCATTGVPLYIVYYFMWENGTEEAKIEMERIAEYYSVEIDL